MIDEPLLDAYRRTTYRAFVCGEQVDIRIGIHHARLDELLGGKSWAFVSACNPGSILRGDNAERHKALVLRLDAYECHPGIGIPDEGDWPPEKSILASGISCPDALRIGREFGQNAIVCGECRGEARLVLAS